MNVSDMRVMMLVHEQFEDLELWYPVLRLREAGVRVDLVGERAGDGYTGKYGVAAIADCGFSQVDADAYQGLLVPGGWAPDKIRRFPAALDLVRNMHAHHKPIAQICHAGWVLISADVLRGRRVTSTPAIKDDMINAGAVWEDAAVVVDKNLVSSRRPADLPEYMKAYVSVLEQH